MSETTTGLIGEYIAAAAILSLGWRVSMAQQDRVDMVAWRDNEVYIRVQAKTASLLGNKDGRSPRHHFQLGHVCKAKHLPTKDDYDVLCLVSPNARRVLFMPVTSVRQYSLRLQPSRFEIPDGEAESWDKAVAVVMETRR